MPDVDMAPRRGTRPRNRRALILAAAARLFVERGYPQVSMNDIATAVGITPPALYRHIRNKEDILQKTIEAQFFAVRQALESARTWEACSAGLALVILRNRHLGILWQRESRHLERGRRKELRNQLVEIHQVLAECLRGHRSGLTVIELDLLAWSTLTAAMSISFHTIQVPHAEYVRLLTTIIDYVVRADVSAALAVPERIEPSAPVQVGSTADRLVQAALELFAEHGFKSVTMSDVAAAVGIAGPSAYNYFASKADLLTAAIGDGARLLMTEGTEIRDEHRPPRQALRRLLRSYVDFSFAHHHVLELIISEVDNVDPPRRSELISQQRQYVQAWVRVLRDAEPGLSAEHARIRVQAVLTLTNDLARTTHLRSRSGTREAAKVLGAEILGLGQN